MHDYWRSDEATRLVPTATALPQFGSVHFGSTPHLNVLVKLQAAEAENSVNVTLYANNYGYNSTKGGPEIKAIVGDKIIIHFSSICPKTSYISSFITKIKMSFKGIIKEDSIGGFMMHANIKWNTFVQWISILAKCILVGCPIMNTFSPKI